MKVLEQTTPGRMVTPSPFPPPLGIHRPPGGTDNHGQTDPNLRGRTPTTNETQEIQFILRNENIHHLWRYENIQ